MTQSHSFLKSFENGSVQTHCPLGWFGQMDMMNADDYKYEISPKFF